jgi:hypothetical protein
MLGPVCYNGSISNSENSPGMDIKYRKSNNKNLIAELADANFLIKQPQDILDIFGDLMSRDCDRIIIHERNLHADFFDLKTRLAGEVLQKFSNYRVKLAIVGDFTKYQSKSLQDFIFESNKSNFVFFTDNIESAIQKLGEC